VFHFTLCNNSHQFSLSSCCYANWPGAWNVIHFYSRMYHFLVLRDHHSWMSWWKIQFAYAAGSTGNALFNSRAAGIIWNTEYVDTSITDRFQHRWKSDKYLHSSSSTVDAVKPLELRTHSGAGMKPRGKMALRLDLNGAQHSSLLHLTIWRKYWLAITWVSNHDFVSVTPTWLIHIYFTKKSHRSATFAIVHSP
jgi:hypothetical protein